MIKVLIPTDAEFYKYESECQFLYEKCQDKIQDTNSFQFIKNNTFFYLFLTPNNKLIGSIYFFIDDGKLFLNGFAKRKMLDLKLECLSLSLTWFNCDIYAEAQNRASALILLKSGFIRHRDNIFIKKIIS